MCILQNGLFISRYVFEHWYLRYRQHSDEATRWITFAFLSCILSLRTARCSFHWMAVDPKGTSMLLKTNETFKFIIILWLYAATNRWRNLVWTCTKVLNKNLNRKISRVFNLAETKNVCSLHSFIKSIIFLYLILRSMDA